MKKKFRIVQCTERSCCECTCTCCGKRKLILSQVDGGLLCDDCKGSVLDAAAEKIVPSWLS